MNPQKMYVRQHVTSLYKKVFIWWMNLNYLISVISKIDHIYNLKLISFST